MKDILFSLFGLVLAGAIIYGCYWVGKTVSYGLFYESMVESTVNTMVKPSCLK